MTESQHYPSPPWKLKANGLMVFSLPNTENLSVQLPDGCSFRFSWLPKTLAGFYIGSYQTPLVEEESIPWHEWGNVQGYATCGDASGFTLSIMAVDSPAAYMGGREAWGLNKIMGNILFESQNGKSQAQLETESGKIHLMWNTFGPAITLSRSLKFLTSLYGKPHSYQLKMRSRNQVCRVTVLEHDEPAFTALSSGKYWGLRFTNADMEISSPVEPAPR